MKFDYYAFDVEPYVKKGVQPLFWLDEKLEPTSVFYTLSDPATGEYSKTLANSAHPVVRMPVFAISTPSTEGSDLQYLTHGSLLTALGMEVAMRFLNQLNLDKPAVRAVILMAQTCHQLADRRYRAYCGITIEARQ